MKFVVWATFANVFSGVVLADPAVADRSTVTAEGAKTLIAKAEAKARSLHRAVNIAVGVSGADSSTDVPIAETALAEAMR
jgi:uncharacterized protein GlcG (DUF336 family)